MRIAIDAFRGVRPRLDPRLINAQEAQLADNCRLWSGALGAWKKPLNVESGATNWLLWSERLDNAAWFRSNLIDVLANVTPAPDGTNLADKLRENTANEQHFIVQTVVKGLVAEAWTGSISIKAAERGFAQVQLTDFIASNRQIIVNLATGAIAIIGGPMAFLAASTEDEGNGWWRVHLSCTSSLAGDIGLLVGPALNAATASYLGTLNSGVYAFGGQLRKGVTTGPYTATESVAFPSFPVSFYLFKNLYWFKWAELTRAVKAPYAGDTADITVISGATGVPLYTYSPIAEDVALRSVMPRHTYALGLPVPPNPPTVALSPRTGVITGATTVLATAGAQAVASFTISGIVPDGDAVKASVTFNVTINASTARNGRLVMQIQRVGGPILGSATLQIAIPTGATSITIPYTMDSSPDSGYPAGALGYNFSTTVIADSGAFGAVTYNHTGANVRYAGKTLVASVAHGLVTGGLVTIAGVVGCDALNGEGLEILSVPNANAFWVAQDAQGKAYVSGGTWTEAFSADELQDTAYLLTYLCTIGNLTFEGPPSDASNIIARGDSERTLLSTLATTTPADGLTYQITGKRLYRTNVSSDGLNAVYQFVAEIPFANTTYTDSARGFDLGEELPSKDWVKPPIDLRGIISLTNGVLVGHTLNTVCFSEPFEPHAWPLKYQIAFDAEIVTQVSFGNATAILTKGNPAIIYGTVPGQMRVERAELPSPCVSERSAVDMGYAVVYAADNGLAYLSTAGAQVITSKLFTEKEWKSFNPPSIIGASYDNRYVGFYTKLDGTRGGFVFDPQDELQSWAPLDFGADALWTDPATGDLYVLIDEWIARWAKHPTDTYFYRWRSKRFGMRQSYNLSHAKLEADLYPVELTCYANIDPKFPESLRQVFSNTVTNGLAFAMPQGFRGTAFEFEFRGRGDGKLKNFVTATSLDELQAQAT